MDYNAQEKCNNNSILIALLYNEEQAKYAASLKDQILHRYSEGIRNCTIKVELVPYSSDLNINAHIYYLFPATQAKIKKALIYASLNHALSFSYLQEDLALGAMISVKIGAKVKPLLNLEAIKSNNFTFRPVLLEISEIFVHEVKTR